MTALPPTVLTTDAVCAALTRFRYAYPDESGLQAALSEALSAAEIPVTREVQLTARDRIDILCGRIGIEVKTAGTAIAAYRQCQRYAHSDALDALVLLTTRVDHATLPTTVGGKPLRVVLLNGAL